MMTKEHVICRLEHWSTSWYPSICNELNTRIVQHVACTKLNQCRRSIAPPYRVVFHQPRRFIVFYSQQADAETNYQDNRMEDGCHGTSNDARLLIRPTQRLSNDKCRRVVKDRQKQCAGDGEGQRQRTREVDPRSKKQWYRVVDLADPILVHCQ